MKILTIFFLTILTLASCSSNRDEEIYNYDISFALSLKNENGIDLLDPVNPIAIKESEIKLYYLIDGKMVEVYDKEKDYPRNFHIFKHGEKYRIEIFLNYDDSKTELPETYIYWDNSRFEKITTKVARTNSLVAFEKVWINNNLIWQTTSNTEKYFELTK